MVAIAQVAAQAGASQQTKELNAEEAAARPQALQVHWHAMSVTTALLHLLLYALQHRQPFHNSTGVET